uniref:Uncharacterized protein n=1 Tax=Sphaerodactylus townsendi TaxID=933632 RepID=A0ACB8F6Y1_9SAUR
MIKSASLTGVLLPLLKKETPKGGETSIVPPWADAQERVLKMGEGSPAFWCPPAALQQRPFALNSSQERPSFFHLQPKEMDPASGKGLVSEQKSQASLSTPEQMPATGAHQRMWRLGGRDTLAPCSANTRVCALHREETNSKAPSPRPQIALVQGQGGVRSLSDPGQLQMGADTKWGPETVTQESLGPFDW